MVAKTPTTTSLTTSTLTTKPTKKKKHNGYNWSNADKLRAVSTYKTVGTYYRTEQLTGIPQATLHYWAKQEWWGEELLKVEKQDSEELKVSFTRIAKRSSELLEDRLENGDDIVTKDGSIVKRNIPGKELAIIMAVAADKRKQEIQTPNSLPTESQTEKLAKLMVDFINFSKGKEIKGYAKDLGTFSEPITGEGHVEGPSIRSGDESAPEGGGLEAGNSGIDGSGS